MIKLRQHLWSELFLVYSVPYIPRMDIPTIVGSVGVALLLVAFVLNMLKKLHESHWLYLAMNAVGSLMAMYYAIVGENVPFIILEATWGLAALVRLIQLWTKKAPRPL